jgi:hypothetical protein
MHFTSGSLPALGALGRRVLPGTALFVIDQDGQALDPRQHRERAQVRGVET